MAGNAGFFSLSYLFSKFHPTWEEGRWHCACAGCGQVTMAIMVNVRKKTKYPSSRFYGGSLSHFISS